MKKGILLLGLLLGLNCFSWGQPWIYDLGSATGSHTSGSSTSFLPAPPSGSTYVRVGTTAGSVNLENFGTGIQKLGSDVRLRIVAPTSASIVKASVLDYTAGKSFYTKFTLLLGGADGSNVSSGTFSFWQGDGDIFSNTNAFSGTKVFTGIRFVFGLSGAITTNYRNGGNWSVLGSTPVSQSNVYTFEIFGNNTTSTINYSYNGNSVSVANNKQDIYINGSLIGDDLSKAQLPNDANVDSWMFYGESSINNVANIFLDDITYSNSIAASYTTNLNYYSKSTGVLNTNTNWTTNVDGTGVINPSNFITGYSTYNIRNNAIQTIDAAWTVSGNSSKILVGDGTNSCAFTAANNVTVQDLEINSSGSFTINPGVQVTVNGTLTNSASSGLVIESSGSLIQSSSGVDATVKRAFNSWSTDKGWHFVSSPVSSQTISGAFTVIPDTEYDFYKWDEAENLWMNQKVVANNITSFTPGVGYLAAYKTGEDKLFTGDNGSNSLNYQDITFNNLAIHTGTNQGWHLLGNPYPSALQWNNGSWAMTAITATAKIWNEANASYSDIAANGYIPALNGFMVEVTNATNGLTIPASAQVHNATPWYKSSDCPTLALVANDPTGQTAQESVVKFNPEATPAFDPAFDSHYLSGYAPDFYSVAGTEQLSTNALPESGGAVTIPFNFVKNNATAFSIEAKTISGIHGPVILHDLKTGAAQDLTQDPLYAFTASAGDDPARFTIAFSHVGAPDQPVENPARLYASGNTLYISGASGNGTVTVYDITGRQLMQDQFNEGGPLAKLTLGLTTGYYIVKVVTERQTVTNKVFIH